MRSDLKTDVAVVGGGASGLPAAIAAARAGARVVLIEEDPVLGGAVTDAGVDMLCGGPRTGIVREIEQMLAAATNQPHPTGRFFLPLDWQWAWRELVRREADLSVLAGARAVEAILADGVDRPRVAGVRVAGATGETFSVEARVIIDATGSGALAVMAGCESMYGREARDDFDEPHAPPRRDDHVQDCTWMYISQQMPGAPAFDMTRLENVRRGVLVRGVGWFHNHAEQALRAKVGVYLHWGCAVTCQDTRDPIAVADAQAEALEAMDRDLALLRENGHQVYLAPCLGVRESRRIVGEHVLSECDLRRGELPDDTVAIGNYSLDIWRPEGPIPPEERRLPMYGIPYRSLVPRDVDGLLLAGKSFSATHIAMSSCRVMPIVGAAGQAAGAAAAWCARNGCTPREANPQEIRVLLRRETQDLALCVEQVPP